MTKFISRILFREGSFLGGFYSDYIARVLIIRTTIYTESSEWENSIFQEKDKTVAL